MKDRSDWMLCPEIFNKINTILRPLQVDLFASKLTHQVQGYVCRRPDPEAMATDAFILDWMQFQGYANPPMNLIGRVLSHVSNQETQVTLVTPVRRACTNMVPNPPGDDGTNAHRSPKHSKPDHADPQSQQTRHNTTASRMRYLRDRFKNQNLSERASELLLASWQQNTWKTYDSLFGKWLVWCCRRNTNPIAGDINEVVNFLADLFEQGYQYCSLNVYRSAISSVHEKVDGYEVGQHTLVTCLINGAFHERPPQPRY